jgi:hypothetical protein
VHRRERLRRSRAPCRHRCDRLLHARARSLTPPRGNLRRCGRPRARWGRLLQRRRCTLQRGGCRGNGVAACCNAVGWRCTRVGAARRTVACAAQPPGSADCYSPAPHVRPRHESGQEIGRADQNSAMLLRAEGPVAVLEVARGHRRREPSGHPARAYPQRPQTGAIAGDWSVMLKK